MKQHRDAFNDARRVDPERTGQNAEQRYAGNWVNCRVAYMALLGCATPRFQEKWLDKARHSHLALEVLHDVEEVVVHVRLILEL